MNHELPPVTVDRFNLSLHVHILSDAEIFQRLHKNESIACTKRRGTIYVKELRNFLEFRNLKR